MSPQIPTPFKAMPRGGGSRRLTDRHREVVDAFRQRDELAIRRLGWDKPYFARSSWWGRKARLVDSSAFLPYVELVGDKDPGDVLEAFRALTGGEWPPSPSEVRGHLHPRTRTNDSTIDVGRGRDRTSTPDAHAAALTAHRAGEAICKCSAPHSNRTCDDRWVLRCPLCRGLDRGQVWAGEDAELEEAA